MKIVCDKCKKKFDSSKIKLKEVNVTDEIIEISYKCPKCKEKYIVGYKDKEILENIQKIKELDREATNVTNNNDIVNLLKMRKNLKDRNVELSERYKSFFREC